MEPIAAGYYGSGLYTHSLVMGPLAPWRRTFFKISFQYKGLSHPLSSLSLFA
jgi:hypothetical protein